MKHFLHTALLLSLLAASASPAFSQEDELPALSEERLKEIKAQKTAYLTSKMELTPEEAQKFWPVYNQYDKELETVRKERREAYRAMGKDSDLTDAAAAAAIEKELGSQQRELDIRKRYSAEFTKLIGARKTLLLARSEREFLREMMRRLRERRDGPEGGPGGRGPGRR